MSTHTRPYGTWASPISAAAVAGKSTRFGMLQADGGAVYWSESRPDEGGRGVIVRADSDGHVEDVLPPPWSARSRVNEYGGGEFLATGGHLFFVEAESQDIHELAAGGESRRLTREADTRFADMTHDTARGRLIAVAEVHGQDAHEPESIIAVVPLTDSADAAEIATLVSGADFYASPRISPDGDKLAWLAWNLPQMPWDGAALFVADIGSEGELSNPRLIAGGEVGAAFQPEWGSDGHLYFVSDASGWGRLCVWNGQNVREVVARDADLLRPQWVFGTQSYALLGDGTAAAAFIEEGETELSLIDLATGDMAPCPSGLRAIDALAPYGDGVALIGAGDASPPAVFSLGPNGMSKPFRDPGDRAFGSRDISVGEVLKLEGSDGLLYALYYPPTNASCAAPEGELPPTIILAHGGPTGMADRGLKLKTQFWTSRGFAVCDLDYSGSAGYGRAYRERLNGLWGVRDVQDVASLARHLKQTGRADPNRMLISGGSAGGYTVLMALVMLEVFAAGACSYAVADLAQLQRFTHKFESGYLYGLTGTAPETCDAVFAERSPINHADRISSPVIFFQGLDDLVVPPEQSRAMAETLRARGVPVAYKEFPGEGHGFRSADTIIDVLQSEYAFYAQILGLEPSETLPEIPLENWSP